MALVPCAVCQFMKHECDSNTCIFVSSFPATEPEKFDRVERVFGAENVFKLMGDPKLNSWERNLIATSLSYEAEARMNDPIHGYVGISLVFQKILNSLKQQIDSVKAELAAMVGPERVPPYANLPMPDHFLTTRSSLNAVIDSMTYLTEARRNELKQLPILDAQRIVIETVWMRENQEMGDDQ